MPAHNDITSGIRRQSRDALFIALALSAFAPASFATQNPGSNAWDALRPDSDAYRVIKQRCQADAGEEFYAVAEGVTGLFMDAERGALAHISGGPSSYGISYVNPTYLFRRNGLRFMEIPADLPSGAIFGTNGGDKDHPYVRVDLTAPRWTPVDERAAQVRIVFKRTTTDEEVKLGVHGRLIEVSEEATGKLLARRRDYVWINPDSRNAHGGYICPTVQEGESLPISFLAKAVNVSTFTCWSAYQAAVAAIRPGDPTGRRSRLIGEMNACQDAYLARDPLPFVPSPTGLE